MANVSVNIAGLETTNTNLANIQRSLSALFQQLAGVTVLGQWSAGAVTALGTDISISGTTLNVTQNWTAGAVSSIGAGLNLSLGVLTATAGQWSAGVVTTLGSNLAITGTTLNLVANPTLEAGNSGNTFQAEGALSKQFGTVGTGADTTDDTLFTYNLPANSFDANGRSLIVEAFGSFANNANMKDVKLWFGTSIIFDAGSAILTNQGWYVRLMVMRTGSGAQIGSGEGTSGPTVFGAPLPLVGSEADTGAITIRVTGSSPITGAANDVVGRCFIVRFVN